MGPGIVGLTFDDRVGKEDTGPDAIELHVELGVGIGAVGTMFGNVVTRKTPDLTLSGSWWGRALLILSQCRGRLLWRPRGGTRCRAVNLLLSRRQPRRWHRDGRGYGQ